MGFNYLQTDDRDDYFSQFKSEKTKKKCTGITLTSPEGDILFDNAPMFKVRTYCKKKYLPIGKGAKKIWRNILLEKGYKVNSCF